MRGVASLVGRAEQIDTFDQLLSARKRGRMIAVSGEAGIGKSRLLSEWSLRAEDAGWLVLCGRAAEFERDVPFAMFVDALDDYLRSLSPQQLKPLGEERLGELSRAFPGIGDASRTGRRIDSERYRLHRATRALIEALALPRPVLLMLDDIHWADPGSRELLGYLLRHPPRERALIAVAYRPTQVGSLLGAELAVAEREKSLVAVRVGPLSVRETAQLLDEQEDDSRLERLFRLSGGNPFFAEQLARSVSDAELLDADVTGAPGDVPEVVVAAIARELAGLGERARLLVDGAAVTGDPFDLDLAAVAGSLDQREASAALDELLQLDLVRLTEVPTRFRFRHPIVRRAVYDACRHGWRTEAHRRLLCELRSRHAPADELVHHVAATARPGDIEAIALLVDAAQAVANRAPAVAARRLQAALRLDPVEDQRLELLVLLADALSATGEMNASRAALLEALSSMPDDEIAVRVALTVRCAQVEQLLGKYEDAHTRLVGLLASLPESDSAEGAAVRIALAGDVIYASDFEAGARWAQQARQSARAAGAPALNAAAQALLSLACVCIGAGRMADAEHHCQSTAGLIDSLTASELAECLEAVYYVGLVEDHLHRYEDGARHVGRGIAVSRETGQGMYLTQLRTQQAWNLAALGRLSEATAIIDDALDGAYAQANAQAISFALLVGSAVAAQTGDLDLALRRGEAAVAGAVDESVFSLSAHASLATACCEAGDFRRCLEHLQNAGAPDFAGFAHTRRPRWSELLTRAYLGLDRLDDAATAVVQTEALADGLDPLSVASARRARARLLLVSGPPEEAVEHALAAADGQLSRGARVEAARSRILAGTALVACGRAYEAEAEAELERAHAELGACGAMRWRDEAARALRRLGQHVNRTGTRGYGTGVSALSAREREIAERVCVGDTNKQIAAALFLSEKTIEKHLSSVFAKLGVTRRAAVGAHMQGERARRA